MIPSLKLFKFQGVPVYLKLWFLALFFFLPPTYVVVIFISVLVHELSHTYVAHKLGYYVESLYVDIFNGAAMINMNHCPERDSIKIIGSGPLSNLILSILSFIVGVSIRSILPESTMFFSNMVYVNLLLFIFNILPIYPIDGGRILKDFLFMKMRSNRRLANDISGWVSMLFSCVLLLFGIINFNILLILFSVFFIYTSLKELNFLK